MLRDRNEITKAFFPLFNPNNAFFEKNSHQRPKTKSKADSIAQEPTKKHPSITNSKNLPPTIVPHLFSNPSGIYFQNAWQKATCHRNFMANTKIHSRVQTLHQWSSVQQFLTCMNFYHGCRLWLPSEKPVQSSWCWDLSTNPQMMCPLLATSTTMDSKPPATVTLGLALNSFWWAFSTTKTPLNK